MEYVTLFLSVISQISDVALVVLLIALAVIFHEPIVHKLGLSSKRDYEDGLPIMTTKDLATKVAKVEKTVIRLEQYWNHDVTEKIDRIIQYESDGYRVYQELRDTLRDIKTLLKNIDKYGVTCRNHNN